MIDNLAILTHTHTDCKDLWNPYVDSYRRFFPQKHYYLSNGQVLDEETIIYSESIKYSSRLLHGLSQIKEKFVIIDLEDMPLYGKVDCSKIDDLLQYIDPIPFIRLLKSGISGADQEFIPSNGLNWIKPDDLSFSITPTIWDRQYLLEVLKDLPDLSPWELEITASSTHHKGLYWHSGEKKRGLAHHDSSIYPHVCTAICKGKWNVSEYKEELDEIFDKYSINPNIRGVC